MVVREYATTYTASLFRANHQHRRGPYAVSPCRREVREMKYNGYGEASARGDKPESKILIIQ